MDHSLSLLVAFLCTAQAQYPTTSTQVQPATVASLTLQCVELILVLLRCVAMFSLQCRASRVSGTTPGHAGDPADPMRVAATVRLCARETVPSTTAPKSDRRVN